MKYGKKIISICLALCMIVSAVPPTSVYASETAAAVEEIDAAVVEATALTTESEITRSGENGFIWEFYADGTLVISPKYWFTFYSEMDQPWYNWRDEITNVVIEDGIEFLCPYMFYNCTNLASVTIPDSVETIDYYAFCNCDSLTSVMIPESVTTVGEYAFYDCTNLKSVTIPEGVTTISKWVFSYCSNLTSVTISDSVTTIGTGAFYECTSLKSVTIPEGVTTIGNGAFDCCSSLTNVTYCGTEEQWNAITVEDGNDPLTGATRAYHNWVDSDGQTVCDLCGDIQEEAPIRSGEKGFIWEFYADGTLVISPKYWFTFYSEMDQPWYNWRDEIKNVIIEDGIGFICPFMFYNCTDLASVTIPDSVTSIGEYAFYLCNGLETVEIPAGVQGISERAFGGCGSLTAIQVSEDNTQYSDNMGVLFNKAQTALVQFPAGISGHYAIPDGVTVVNSNAFFFCEKLTSVTIPDSVTEIGSNAFGHCYQLTCVNIPDSVTTIRNHAFSMSGVTSVTIGSGVTAIGDCAFLFCGEMTVTFLGNAPSIGESCFGDVTATVRYGANASGWTTDVKRSYGGTLTWVAVPVSVNLMQGTGVVSSYPFMEKALESYDPATQYLKLRKDTQVNISLNGDLYIDLNGYDLTGTIVTNGYQVYGMDATTNGYSCSKIGYFNCVDADGAAIVPVRHFKTEAARTGYILRYMAIQTDAGWSFHRFYIGISKLTVRPGETAFGYKAIFGADEMVLAQLDPDEAYGYGLWLDSSVSKTQVFSAVDSFETGREVSLLLKNIDVANYGASPVYAEVYLKLADGTLIDSAEFAYTFRNAMEQISASWSAYNADQQALAFDLCMTHIGTMGQWNIPQILAGMSTEQIVNAAYALPENSYLTGAYTLTGVITEINTEYSYTYKNITVTMQVDDRGIQCFRLADGIASVVDLAVGDTITVTGCMKNYYGIVEFDQGCVLDAVIPGENSGITYPDPVMVTELKTGTSYKLYVYQETMGKNLYFAGSTQSETVTWRLDTTVDPSEAVDVYLEDAEGGYYLYFIKDSVKTYISALLSDTHYNLALTTEPSTVYYWNAEYNTVTTNVEGTDCYIGAHSTYDNIGCGSIGYISSSYPVHFSAVESADGGDSGSDSGSDSSAGITYTFSDYEAGVQYALEEEHVLDENTSVITNDAHFSSALRLYDSSSHDGTAVIKSAATVNALTLSVGYKVGTLQVSVSEDGASWTVLEDVSISATSFTEYTVQIPDGTNYIKLDSINGVQLRVQWFTLLCEE